MKILLSLLALCIIHPSFAKRHPLIHHNYSYVEKGSRYDNGYPEERYEFILGKVREIYGPLIQARGGTLHIMSDWTDGAVNMWAWRIGAEYWLEVPGGMSRYHLISEEGFITTICHELGHLMGGYPNRNDISFEGQSDYYSTKTCGEIMFSRIEPFQKLADNNEVDQICSGDSREECTRILKGSLSLTSYYAELEKVPAPKFSTPSRRVVRQTQRSHPKAQCRLDTLLSGFLNNPRPKCWFID